MRKTVSIVCFLLLAAGIIPALAQTKPGKASKIHPVYKRWVSEDVAYLINAEEKKQYFGFKTDAEREQFISQFWQLHAVKAGVSTEEFREAYYKRIAYANEHFASGKAPGWKTTKGRKYIQSGRI